MSEDKHQFKVGDVVVARTKEEMEADPNPTTKSYIGSQDSFITRHGTGPFTIKDLASPMASTHPFKGHSTCRLNGEGGWHHLSRFKLHEEPRNDTSPPETPPTREAIPGPNGFFI